MKEMISSGGIDAVKFAEEMHDSFTEEERRLYDEKYPTLTPEEYQAEFKSAERD